MKKIISIIILSFLFVNSAQASFSTNIFDTILSLPEKKEEVVKTETKRVYDKYDMIYFKEKWYPIRRDTVIPTWVVPQQRDKELYIECYLRRTNETFSINVMTPAGYLLAKYEQVKKSNFYDRENGRYYVKDWMGRAYEVSYCDFTPLTEKVEATSWIRY